MKVGADRDAQVSGGAQNVQGLGVGHVLETLTVDFEDLIAALEAHLLGFGALLDAGDEDAEAPLEAAQNGKVQHLVARRPRQRHRPAARLGGAGEIQHPQLNDTTDKLIYKFY